MPLTLLLHGRHAGDATRYEPLGDWIVPWRFSRFEEEYRALRETAGLMDYSRLASLRVEGPDRVEFLHRLLSQDIAGLVPGQGCEAALLAPSAKLIATMLVLADAESLWLFVDLPQAHAVAETLERYHFGERLTITDLERSQAVLAVQGPRAEAVAADVCGRPLALAKAGEHRVLPAGNLLVRWVQHSVTGGPGLSAVVDAASAEALWTLLQEAGWPLGLRLVGWEALNAARIEAGIPWFGLDVTTGHLLPETGLVARLASETKGCYVGQEIVARMQTYGSPGKRLVGLSVQGAEVPAPGDPVIASRQDSSGSDEAVVLGEVTSACYSPALDAPIALGMVKRGAYAVGTAVAIAHGAARLPATVAALPFVKVSDT